MKIPLFQHRKLYSIKMDFWHFATGDETQPCIHQSRNLTHNCKTKQKSFYPPSGQTLFSVRLCYLSVYLGLCHSLLLQLSDFVRGAYLSLKVLVMDRTLEYKGILGERESVWRITLFLSKHAASYLENGQLILLSNICNHLRLYLFVSSYWYIQYQ